jgi:hypothetical protein
MVPTRDAFRIPRVWSSSSMGLRVLGVGRVAGATHGVVV